MLAIRLQRTGRSGHSQFRLIVQDSRFSPKRGRIVTYLGSYNPHTKEFKLDAEKLEQHLKNGAQPSDRVAQLLKKEGIKLPDWVKVDEPRQRATRNPDKRRSTRPAEAEAPAPTAESAAEAEAVTEQPEAPAEEAAPANQTETPAEEAALAEEPAAKAPAEETPAESEAPAETPAEEPEKPAA